MEFRLEDNVIYCLTVDSLKDYTAREEMTIFSGDNGPIAASYTGGVQNFYVIKSDGGKVTLSHRRGVVGDVFSDICEKTADGKLKFFRRMTKLDNPDRSKDYSPVILSKIK